MLTGAISCKVAVSAVGCVTACLKFASTAQRHLYTGNTGWAPQAGEFWSCAGVEFAEEDKQLHAYGWGKPDDPGLPQQWAMYELGLFQGSNLQNTSMPLRAWNRSTGSDGVIICVIDSGIDYHHPDLQANIWINHHEIPDNGIDDDHNGYVDDYYGYNFLANDGNPMDNNFHGTHLAGKLIIVQECNKIQQANNRCTTTCSIVL